MPLSAIVTIIARWLTFDRIATQHITPAPNLRVRPLSVGGNSPMSCEAYQTPAVFVTYDLPGFTLFTLSPFAGSCRGSVAERGVANKQKLHWADDANSGSKFQKQAPRSNPRIA